MILVDANLLIYAHSSNFDQHTAARAWLDEQMNGRVQIGLPWICLLAFLPITTNPRLFPRPHSIAKAWEQVSAWLARDNVWVPSPTERHASILAGLLVQGSLHGDLVTDAHLAALAIEHGLLLCSADRYFARFANLRWINPLAQA